MDREFAALSEEMSTKQMDCSPRSQRSQRKENKRKEKKTKMAIPRRWESGSGALRTRRQTRTWGNMLVVEDFATSRSCNDDTSEPIVEEQRV